MPARLRTGDQDIPHPGERGRDFPGNGKAVAVAAFGRNILEAD